jgi:hypothetical protein
MVDTKKVLGPGDDLEMLCKPELWPKWPMLPMKNYKLADPKDHGFPLCGIVYDEAGADRYPVYLGNTFCNPDPADPDVKKLVYDTFAKMLAAGWVVD